VIDPNDILTNGYHFSLYDTIAGVPNAVASKAIAHHLKIRPLVYHESTSSAHRLVAAFRCRLFHRPQKGLCRRRRCTQGLQALHSRPVYYGALTAMWFTTIGIVLSVLFESICASSRRSLDRVLLRHPVEPADRAARRSGRLRRLRRHPAVHRHPADLRHRHAGGGAHRAAVGDLPVRIRRGKVRAWAKPVLEILAGIPTVVYGFFAALTVAPFMRDLGRVHRAGRRLRERAGRRSGDGRHDHPLRLVAVGRRHQRGAAVLRDGSYALGATQSETIAG
jgi:hypothetical protein